MTERSDILYPLNDSDAFCTVQQSEDGSMTALLFKGLELRMDQGDSAAPVRSHVATFQVPVQFLTGPRTSLQKIGYRLDADENAGVAILVHAAGQSILVDLPALPASNVEIEQEIAAAILADGDYVVTFVLIGSVEIESPDATVFLAIESLVIESDSVDDISSGWSGAEPGQRPWRKGPVAGRLAQYGLERGLASADMEEEE